MIFFQLCLPAGVAVTPAYFSRKEFFMITTVDTRTGLVISIKFVGGKEEKKEEKA